MWDSWPIERGITRRFTRGPRPSNDIGGEVVQPAAYAGHDVPVAISNAEKGRSGPLIRPFSASCRLRHQYQFLRRLARYPFAHPHPPLFERDSASLEMQYLRSPGMHTARISAVTVTFLKDGARTVTFVAHLL